MGINQRCPRESETNLRLSLRRSYYDSDKAPARRAGVYYSSFRKSRGSSLKKGTVVPLVSILIPAYNSESYLNATIESALNQMWPNLEIIIVDDGSTDDTLAIARSFESRILKVISQPHAGASTARNRALSVCQGDYIQWLDADDLLSPTKIATQMRAAEFSPDSRVLFSCPFGFFYHWIEAARFKPTRLWQSLEPVDWIITKFSHNAYIAVHAWLTSRPLAEAAGRWDVRLRRDQDGEYFTRVVSASSKVVFVPGAECYYRIGIPTSLSASPRRVSMDELVKSLTISHLLELEDSPRTRDACCKLLQCWADSPDCRTPEAKRTVQKLADYHRCILRPSRPGWKYSVCDAVVGRETTDRIRALRVQLHHRLARASEQFKSILIRVFARIRSYPNPTGSVTNRNYDWRER